MRLDGIKNLFNDDEKGVSPVIGVILMVAITVILAAVIGTFVLGLGQELPNSQAPTVNLEFEYNSGGKLTVVHNGGDSVTSSRLKVAGSGVTNTYTFHADGTVGGASKKVSAGDTLTVPSGEVNPGKTVKVIWTSEGGGSSQTLADYDIPS